MKPLKITTQYLKQALCVSAQLYKLPLWDAEYRSTP